MTAAGTTITVQGADRLAATMRAADRALQDFSGPNAQAAELLAAQVRRRAPRRTGALAASIRTTSTATTAEVAAGVRYARFPEYGTRYMRAQSFMRPAADDGADLVLPLYADKVTADLSRIAGA